MKRLIASFAALLAVACLVSACGQKGPLYLPDDAKADKRAHGPAHSHTHSPSSDATSPAGEDEESAVQPQ